MTFSATPAALPDALARAPFHLKPADLAWVERRFEQLSPRHRLAQLFNVMLRSHEPADLAQLAAMRPGAVTHRLSAGLDATRRAAHLLSADCDVPLLFSADVEGGAISPEGCTPMSNQLGMAAMGQPALYEQAVDVMAREAAAIGINWSFTPVVDINAAFRSAIVATRSYGSNPEVIEALARINVRCMQRHGIAATAKHWPGEGHDARDQHLVTTINPLSMDDWRASFGSLYQTLIDDDVFSIMSAHIALPAWAQAHGASGLEAFRPASVSKLLNLDLLRGELGFNGLIVSDATPMAGLGSWGPRARVLPEVIENGCDMVLFTPHLEADLDLLQTALDEGRLSAARVEAAVKRVLAMKAALGLHRQPPAPPEDLHALRASPVHLRVSEATAAASPTLVKDVNGLVPISPARHRRVVIVTDTSRSGFDDLEPDVLVIDRLLGERGFEVRAYDRQQPPTARDTDLAIFVLAQESLLTQSNIYLDWRALLGPMDKAMRRWWHEVPTLLISFGQPYYLYDAPRMPCVVNAYAAVEAVQRAVVRKLLGDEPFTGVSPVDAFCGLADAHF